MGRTARERLELFIRDPDLIFDTQIPRATSVEWSQAHEGSNLFVAAPREAVTVAIVKLMEEVAARWQKKRISAIELARAGSSQVERMAGGTVPTKDSAATAPPHREETLLTAANTVFRLRLLLPLKRPTPPHCSRGYHYSAERDHLAAAPLPRAQ
ncbi:MAG: hypothetical protein C7B46_20270 [Sulfobacillus benefaciens]|uniref:Uncharacterized protein n=1 Tax=Sulfobacillus benefaciens TaxID=453960 RepID=A0A2T2WV20_9FIRM|nr:MAG: hypothetical protein C7B46_20270 [Sulfobacillus benefaciens]